MLPIVQPPLKYILLFFQSPKYNSWGSTEDCQAEDLVQEWNKKYIKASFVRLVVEGCHYTQLS